MDDELYTTGPGAGEAMDFCEYVGRVLSCRG